MSDAQQLRELELLPRMLRSSTAASRTAASSTPGSSAPASGIVLAGNAWGTGTPDQPLRDELLAKHVSAAQSWKGQRDYGLKAKCDTLSEFVENSAFADRAPLTMTAKPVDMCRRRAGERRKRDRSCDEVHPGFCKNLDKDILGKAKRLHRSLFNTISSHSAPLSMVNFDYLFYECLHGDMSNYPFCVGILLCTNLYSIGIPFCMNLYSCSDLNFPFVLMSVQFKF